ncbi:MAG TPA: sodium ion-translocating decarboxylase subunit beta [Pontiellaceae bacterium]|nr:sodium ion-translocating decarboxylase subunit beta [Pontiellaceae bacterium]
MDINFLNIFQGIDVMLHSDPKLAIARFCLILVGLLLVYLGKKGVLEPLLMIPMGLGMATINASVMFFDPINMVAQQTIDPTRVGTLFLDPAITQTDHLMTLMQIDWLQPVYTLMFSNGLVACLVFLGIGSLLDVGFVMARPYTSMFLALCAELGTFVTLPIAHALGLSLKDSASIAMVGGADGPMVLFTSLKLSPELFVPITVVAYLYLGLAYGGFPYLIKLMVPKHIRGIQMAPGKNDKEITSGQKMVFAVVCCTVLCFLFPVASPLFFSLFLGVAIRESGLKQFQTLVSEIVLYGATLSLGLLLGVLCEAGTILSPKVLPLLLLGILSLLLSGIGGLLGGYVLYFLSGKKYNPVIGIAGVSCVPSTAKVAQKCVSAANPNSIVMQYALGANISGVITTAIIAAIYIGLLSK